MKELLSQKVRRARNQIFFRFPFWGVMLSTVKWIKTDNIFGMPNPTAATDGIHLWYNEKFVESLSLEHLIGLFCHESMHIHAKHPIRMKQWMHKEPDLTQKACDYSVNPLLLEAKISLPVGHLYQRRFSGMSAEHIINILIREREQQQQKKQDEHSEDSGSASDIGDLSSIGDQTIAGNWGKIIAPIHDDGTPLDHHELKELENRIDQIRKEAFTVAKRAGKIPTFGEEMVEMISVPPNQNWKEELRQFITKPNRKKYSWLKADRRYPSGLHIPSRGSKSLDTIVLAVDISSSISKRELQIFGSEMNHIRLETLPRMIYVIYCNTMITHVDEYTSEDEIILNVDGRGGTAFSPVFEYLEENEITPSVLIYLTDLACDDFGDEPNYPVLWACTTDNKNAPFGGVLELDVIGVD